MKTRKWRKTETIAIDGIDDYYAVIDTTKDNHGLRLDVYLVNKATETETCIGSYLSRDYDFTSCYFNAFRLLSNEKYCRDIISEWTEFPT